MLRALIPTADQGSFWVVKESGDLASGDLSNVPILTTP